MKNDFIGIYANIKSKDLRERFSTYIHKNYGEKKKVLDIFDEVASAIRLKQDVQNIRKIYTNEKTPLNYLALLKKWLLDFIALEELQSNSIEAKFLRLEALRKQGLYEVYQEKSEKFIEDLEKNYPLSIWHFFWKVKVGHANYFHTPIDRLQNYQSDMILLMQDLDNFYFSAKLLYSAEFYNRSEVSQEEYSIVLLQAVLEILNKKSDINPIVKKLYLTILDLIQSHSKEAYNTLKQFLIENTHHDNLERFAVLLYLLNYSARVLRTNNDDIALEIFSLFRLGIDQSLFTSLGYYHANTVVNIINTACRVGEYEWAHNFIAQCEDKLSPKEKDDTIKVAKARILFDDEKYNQVIVLLRDVNPQNMIFDINVRLLLLRAYFEIEYDQEVMENANNNLYHFAHRSKVLGYSQRLNVYNFHKMYNALISGKKDKKQLLKELNTRKPMFCYEWVKMKIEKLPN